MNSFSTSCQEAELKAGATSRQVETLEKKIAALNEQLASERQLMQDLLEMVLNNSRAKNALAPSEMQALERALERIRQAQNAETEDKTSP
jgi:uncharacterized protein YfkK (UPF0435 family)